MRRHNGNNMSTIKAFFSVSGFTLISRVLGLFRDIIVASVFGASAISDAFFTAFRIPNTLRRFTAEGSLTQAFIPVYIENLQKDPEQARTLAGDVTRLLALGLLVLCTLCLLFAPWVIFALAPGLEKADTAAQLLQIVFPYILFISLASVAIAILNTAGRFFVGAAMPIFLNICMIVAALFFIDYFNQPIFALAWGVFVAGVIQLLWTVYFLYHYSLFPRFRWTFRSSPDVIRVIKLLGYSVLGAGSAQINLLINLFIASTMVAGSISWLYFADRLMELPTGLLGATLATIVLPKLAAKAKDNVAFNRLLDVCLRAIAVLAVPSMAGLALLALPLVSTLFYYGAFTESDVIMTKQATLAYSIGILGLVAERPLAAAFFARQRAAVPVKTALLALFVTQFSNLILLGVFDMGHVGLALSIGIGSTVNALVLFILLRRYGWYYTPPHWQKTALIVLFSTILMSLLLLLITPNDAFWLRADVMNKVGYLSLCVLAAMTVYFSCLYIAGVRLRDFRIQD